MAQQQDSCQQDAVECECTVHRLLRYINRLTAYVSEMLCVECEDDEKPARGRTPVPPVFQECTVPCDVARKKCQNQPCPGNCERAAAYFARKWLPKEPGEVCTPRDASEMVDLSLVKTDCLFFCCRGTEPATNRCVYRKKPPAQVPRQLPLPECCPCMRCCESAAPDKNRCPLRKGLCEYQADDDQPCCDKPPGTCDCAAKRTLYRDQLIQRCTDRLFEIVKTIIAIAEGRVNECGDVLTVAVDCGPKPCPADKCEETQRPKPTSCARPYKTKVHLKLRPVLCPKKPCPKRC